MTAFVQANVMDIPVKFRLHPPYGFWGDDFWVFLRKFNISVAMATNQIQQYAQIHIFGRGLLKEQYCKTFVKISAVREK